MRGSRAFLTQQRPTMFLAAITASRCSSSPPPSLAAIWSSSVQNPGTRSQSRSAASAGCRTEASPLRLRPQGGGQGGGCVLRLRFAAGSGVGGGRGEEQRQARRREERQEPGAHQLVSAPQTSAASTIPAARQTRGPSPLEAPTTPRPRATNGRSGGRGSRLSTAAEAEARPQSARPLLYVVARIYIGG